MKNIFWDIFISWLFSTQGIIVLSSASAMVASICTYMTEALKPYAPLSYYIAFIVGMALTVSIMLLIRSMNIMKTYSGETYITVENNGANLVAEDRKNVWGWRNLPSSSPQGKQATLLFACFDKPILPDTIKIIPLDFIGKAPPGYGMIYYDSRYAIISIIFEERGRYKIHFISHDPKTKH